MTLLPFSRRALFVLMAVACLVYLPGCTSTAATGEKQHAEMVEQDYLYDDPELTAYIDKVGQRLVAHSDRPNGEFTFNVLDVPDINAFAAPGGYIYISRGLLAYLENEAELAGVLGHEIGHITGGHHARSDVAGATSTVVATTAYILTGSSDLADASTMYGTELVSGYGREMELEADGLGAEYMHRAGYDTDALLSVIGVLKDQEQFQRVKAKSSGKKLGTYHGLYATHPRNDKRLQRVIKTAGELDLDTPVNNPEIPGEFQRHIEGLVFGESVQSDRAEDRFYHNKLGFTFEQPPGWSVNTGSRAIIARSADGSAAMTVTVRRRDPAASPRGILEAGAGGTLSDGAELDQAGLKGFTAIAGSGASARRLAVIDYNNLSYLFEGSASDFQADQPQLLSIIESFRPMHPREHRTGTGHYIHYIQVPRGATLASLAAGLRIPDAEAQLRLLNGLYPRGEPRTGDWIKVIR